MARIDDGSGGKKKKKMGFKEDRSKHYWETIKKGKKGADNRNAPGSKSQAGKKKEDPNKAPGGRAKSIVFDEKERSEYLLGMHKRKNERRVDAVIQRRKKHRKDQSKLRRELLEEARQHYNAAAKVPILPDYSFNFQNKFDELDAAERGSNNSSSNSSDIDDGNDDFDENGGRNRHGEAPSFEKEQQFDVGASVTVSIAPLQGKAERLRSLSRQQEASAAAASSQGGKRARSLPKGATGLTSERDALMLDPTLPDIVKQRLAKVRNEIKGAAQPKIAVRHVKEMKKIMKVRQHSRKGHGKKATSGKRKNRKK